MAPLGRAGAWQLESLVTCSFPRFRCTVGSPSTPQPANLEEDPITARPVAPGPPAMDPVAPSEAPTDSVGEAPKPPPSRRTLAWSGIKTVLPLLPGILPFAMIAGSSAVEAGIAPLPALGMSLFIFAGASQLVMVEMWDREAHALVLLATVLLVNLRFTLYSATLAPYFRGATIWRKALPSYLMTDQAALLSLPEFEKHGPSAKPFYFAAAFTLWATWQSGTAVGVLLGATLPESWSLDFAVPLSFLAMLIPAVHNRPTAAAAVAAGGLVLVTRFLPLNLGLIVASLAGVLVGMLCERWLSRTAESA